MCINNGDSLLLRGVIVGRLVLHQRLGSATVEEVDRNTRISASVARSKRAVEVWQKLDLGIVVHTRSEDTRHCDSDVGHRVY